MSDKSTPNDAGASAAIGEIHHGPSKAEIFFEKNLKLLILALLLTIVAAAVFVIMRQLSTAKAQEAGNALVAAESPEALRKVTADYPNSTSALSAQMILAEQLWKEGKEEEALQAYRSLETSGEDHPAVADARFALATIERSKGNLKEAEELFEKTLSNNDAKHLHPLTLIALGDLAKLAGNDEKAKGYYDRKIEDYGDYIDQGYAINRLNLVGVDSPQKVGPPPAVEPSEPQLQPNFPIPGQTSAPVMPAQDTAETALEAPNVAVDLSTDTVAEDKVMEDKPETTELPPGLDLEDSPNAESDPEAPVEDATESEVGQ